MNKYHQLTEEERYRITGLRLTGLSQAQIAQQMSKGGFAKQPTANLVDM